MDQSEELQLSFTSADTGLCVGFVAVRDSISESCCSRNLLYEVMNHTSPTVSLMDESDFGECQENIT